MTTIQGVPDLGPGLRLHLNENTAGCSPKVVEALRAFDAQQLATYPDFRDAIFETAAFLGVDADRIVLTNGLDEGILLASIGYLGQRTPEALVELNGFGPILAQSGRLSSDEFWRIFFPSLTAMVGYWATLSLNMPDFTRFGRSQREQAFGQIVALPSTMTLFAGMGVVITSATVLIYGKPIWDPVDLVGRFDQPFIVAIAMFTVVVATLSVNIAANVVSPANDFSNAFPRLISFRTGGLITGLIGIAMQPWKLLESGDRYISWLITLSGGMGTVAGVLIADYWVVRRQKLQLEDLYLTQGVYTYRAGWNANAVIATAAGCFLAWGGLVVPAMAPLMDYGWFVGAFGSAAIYLALWKFAPPAKLPLSASN